jgi:membrane protease YdiL (CAAX protease family)
VETKEIGTSRVILVIFCGIVILAFAQGISSLAFNLPLPRGVRAMIFGVTYVALCYFMIRVCCRKFLKMEPEGCYINRPSIPLPWLARAIILPVTVSALLLCCPGELSKNNVSTVEAIDIILSAVFIVGLGAGVAEEMVFRGLIMKTLEKRWGRPLAIILPSVIFGLLHVLGVKMNLVDLFFLLVAGTSVGIMFSLIVYESNSIWPSAMVHGVWNMIMIGDILNIGTSHKPGALFSYKLATTSTLITGGAFGVEASIFAISGYLVVILWTLSLLKKKRNDQSSSLFQ